MVDSVISQFQQFLYWLFSKEYLVLIVALIYFAVMAAIEPSLVSTFNLRQLVANLLPLLIVCIGQTMVLIGAGIDLSVPATLALASVFGGLLMNADTGLLAGSVWAAPLGILAMLATGALIGLINGFSVSFLKMPPFIVTLTSWMFFSGLAEWIVENQNMYNLPQAFLSFMYSLGTGVPIIGLIIVFVFGTIAHCLLSYTVLGRWMYAVGMNPNSALISGVPVRFTLMCTYVGCGLCAAVSSMLYTARLETASSTLGEHVLLDVIGGVVIGGTSLFGGRGKILWTLYGVIFITFLGNTLNMLGLTHFVIMMVKGGVILMAALIDVTRSRLLLRAG